jgi:hypothetical protein
VTVLVHGEVKIVVGHKSMLDGEFVLVPNIVRVKKRQVAASGGRDANVSGSGRSLVLLHMNKTNRYVTGRGSCNQPGLFPIVTAIIHDNDFAGKQRLAIN